MQIKLRKYNCSICESATTSLKPYSGSEMKRNEMKYIPFNKIYKNLQQFQVIPENKTQGNLQTT